MSSGAQSIRFRRPTNVTPKEQPKPAKRHTGILQDQLRRAQRRPWNPSFSLAVRILLLVRFSGAMYSNIDDCDEVFNFWEPLHFLDQGYGFQTWEVSPQYAIRSWAYILLHYLPPRLTSVALGVDKRIAFFAVRILLAVMSTLVEAAFFRTVVVRINERVGRYLFFMLLFSAGMWNASTAFLPSSFAMYTSALAFSYAFTPASLNDNRRTLAATLLFAAGAIVGWPFSLALAIPFIFEELFIFSGDRVSIEFKGSWMAKRWTRLITSSLLASLIFIPVIGIDSIAYGKLSLVPWNIVRYNIFGGSERGPDLYGTSPWYFYLSNLALNFNLLLPLALLSLLALAVTYIVDRKRLGVAKTAADQSSPFTILGLRLSPFYLWLGILSLQPHKEERFMFPGYPLLCFNAAVTVYLMRGWLEVLYIHFTKSPYRASRSLMFRNFTFSLIVGSIFISFTRVLALWHYYHAPMTVAHAFQTEELPRLLNATGLLPVFPANTSEDDIPPIDLSPIKLFNITLCTGKEWYRFPGHYLIPTGIHVEFIKSDFHGQLPRHFGGNVVTSRSGISKWWFRPETSYTPSDVNDLNMEEESHYVPASQCDYLIDLDFPLHPVSSSLEPRYAVDSATWDRVFCEPFLDARHSMPLTRIFWLPGSTWQGHNEFGDYCLLKNKALVRKKEIDISNFVTETEK
ncbi:asparagine-linked glycosylation 9 protein isoform a [Crucibulum laeve]|uniref:Mannosyltransferase n=1 Tax=Crucibulum laeve TaxID=68775 RepID=A0A5C3MKZ8_9AGAR|nr:asparagine-linked glycosylation 9 protein isoform a [Crucibulum laeve]